MVVGGGGGGGDPEGGRERGEGPKPSHCELSSSMDCTMVREWKWCLSPLAVLATHRTLTGSVKHAAISVTCYYTL